jgi:hypothetical protein
MTAQRDDNCYLWDMLAAARAVESFVHGRTDADYLADLMRFVVSVWIATAEDTVMSRSKRTLKVAVGPRNSGAELSRSLLKFPDPG